MRPRLLGPVVAFALVVGGMFATQPARAQPTVKPAGPAPGAAAVTQSGIWGGGFVNVIAKSPSSGSQHYAIGGDTAGLLTSDDGGASWTAANAGLQDLSQTTIASIAFRVRQSSEVYSAYGTAFASNSGLLHSADGGTTWTPVAATGAVLPVFDGGHSGGYAAYQAGQAPRATGHLLAFDESRGGVLRHIYAGTFGSGVLRSDDGGLTWTRIALGSDPSNPHCNFTTQNGAFHGCFVTSLLLSHLRGEPSTLYVAVHGGDPANCVGDGVCGGVFEVANADCSGDGCADATTTRISGTPVDPVDPEELLFAGKVLLCACGPDGFYEKGRSDPQLLQRSTNLAFDQSIGTSYAAIGAGGGAVYLGAFNPACEQVQTRLSCHSMYQSTDLGLTWTDLTFDLPQGNIDTTVYGTDVPWWEASQKTNMIDGSAYTAASIAVTSDSPPRVLVAGRSGVWTTTNADQMHWQPAVQGIGAITGLDVAADVNHPGYVYVGMKDWENLNSSSFLDPGTIVQLETSHQEKPAKTAGFALAVDQHDPSVPSAVYLAAGIPGPDEGDIDNGGVYQSSDPTVPLPWVNQNLATDGTCGTRLTPRVIGIAVSRDTQDSAPILWAPTDGCGLYQFAGGAWTRMGANTDLFAQEDFEFSYGQVAVPGGLGRVAYALDRNTGELWRTQDDGAHWGTGPIFTIPQGERDFNDGYIAADPNAVGTSVVWLSTKAATGLHELTCPDHCQVAASWTDTVVPEVPNPGPIAILPCASPCTSVVYVGTRVAEGDTTPSALFKSTPSGGFCDVTGSAPLWAAAGGFPVQLALSTDGAGTVMGYLVTNGNGVIVVSDGSGPSCEGG